MAGSSAFSMNGSYLSEEEALRRALAESSAMAHSAEAALPPLISMRKNLDDLAAEYAQGTRADLYRAKARHLAVRYQALRRVRGDGNCFYRGFHVSWMERLLQLPFSEQSRVWLRVVPEATQHYQDWLPAGQLRAELEFLGKEFGERTRKMCEAARAGSAESTLLDTQNESEPMVQSLRWLRLLTSAYMRKNSDMFEPVCADGTRSFAEFLEAEVETMGVEADEMQVQALTAALQLRVRVEYLDSASTPWSTRSGVHRFLICGPPTLREGSADAQGAHEERTTLVACLLFRPGHYDVLSPKDWAKMDDETEQRAAFVAPVPPDHKPTAPYDRCGHCFQPLLGCWLCGQWVCQGPSSKCARFGLPRAEPGVQDAVVPSTGSSGSLLRSLMHPLPDSFGLNPGQSGAVCHSCLENCPAASTLLDEGAAYCADVFTLTHCVCGLLEFAPSMPEHMKTCSYEKRRAASQAPSQDTILAQSVAEPAAPQHPVVGAAVGAATAVDATTAVAAESTVVAESVVGPSGSDASPPPYPGDAGSSAAGPSVGAASASEPFVMRAPSSISDDDPMTGAGDERLIAGTGMDKAPDTDSHEEFHHVTHEEATGSSLNPDGTAVKPVAADPSVLAHASNPERQPRLPKPPPGYPPDGPSHAAPPAAAPVAGASTAPPPLHGEPPRGPLRKDGEPDMRYAVNRASASGTAPPASHSAPVEAPASAAPPTTDELVDTLMSLGLGIERADAVDALRYAEGDVNVAAANLFAANDEEVRGRRAKADARREERARADAWERAEEQRRLADQAQARADAAERSLHYDQQLAAQRQRWAEQNAELERQRQEREQRREAERQEREQRAEADRQRRAAESAARELAASEARLAEQRKQEDLGREQREREAYERNVRDLSLDPRMHADHLTAEFQCPPEVALRAVQAAIKNRGDLNDAAWLLYEPDEVDWILTSQVVEKKKFECAYCHTRFFTFTAYQRHNDSRRSNGVCPRQQPQPKNRSCMAGGGGNVLGDLWNATTEFFTMRPPAYEVINCPRCYRNVTVNSPTEGVRYTCPHCIGGFYWIPPGSRRY